jgi:integrase
LLNLSLRGIARNKLHIVKQAYPITPDILLKMFDSLDFVSKDNLVYWCLFLFAFFLLARKSNLVPSTQNDLQKPKFLLRKHIIETGNGLLVNIFWSKTIQAGERILQVPLTQIHSSPLCPVSAYKKMIALIPRPPDSPVFVLKSGKVVNYSMYLKKLRGILQSCGFEPNLFSTHSFRRGFATWAFHEQFSAEIIQLMGDWRSDAYKKYLQFDLSDKLKVSEVVSRKISNLYRY